MRWSAAPVVITVIGMALMACTPANPAAGGPSPVDGVWRTDGYGWIIAVHNGQEQTYDVTAVSCLPNHTLSELGGPSPDGVVSFGKDNLPVETLRRTPDGQGRLRLLGTAADIDLLPAPALPQACTRTTPDDPVTTFDVFWATFAENYNSTVRKHVDWNALRAQYRAKVTPSTTSDQLYQILTDMIRPLGDNHATLDGPHGRSFEGKRPGTRDDDDVSAKAATRSVDQYLRENLGVRDPQTWAGGKIAYADLPGGVGYLRITAFQDYHTAHGLYVERAEVLGTALDAVFSTQHVSTWRGLIIDLQYNEGGDDELGLQLAGRLTNVAYTAYTKLARDDPHDPTRYGRPRTVTVTPAAGPRYTGPIRLLTSDLTVSAGETLLEALMARTPAPARFGTTTQGVFADDMQRKLPNGWTFTVGNEDYIASDGRNYEGTGIPPTVPTDPIFTKPELAQHQDAALDAALRTPW